MKKYTLLSLLLVAVLSVALLVSCETGPSQHTLSAEDDKTTLVAGESVQLLVDGAVPQAGAYTFAFAAGGDYATVTDTGLLTASASAAGKTIVVQLMNQTKTASNTLTFEVTARTVPATSVSLSVVGDKQTVPPSGYLTLTADVLPADTTDTVTYEILSGTHCHLSGNILMIDADAPDGEVISLRATAASAVSATLEITVEVPQSDDYWMVLQSGEVTADSGAAVASTVLSANVYNGTTPVTDMTGLSVEYTVKSGAEYILLSADADPRRATVVAKGHGDATVVATLKRGETVLQTDEIRVHAINPPERIDQPEWLQGKKSITFAVGKGAANALTYLPVLSGSGSYCEAYTVSFSRLVGGEFVADEAVAAYDADTHQLIFNETAIVKLTVLSASGSARTVKSEFVFTVNDGVNVADFEALRATLSSGSYTGTPVNMVNTEKHGEYGYSFVPAYILSGGEQTQTDHLNTSIYVAGGDLALYGNGYAIDVSGMAWLGAGDHYGALIAIAGGILPGTTQADHRVTVCDLTMIGNTTVDGTVGGHAFDAACIGSGGINRLNNSFYRAIVIAGAEDTSDAAHTMYATYEVALSGLRVEGFPVGIRVTHAVNSKISGTTVENCYCNGIELVASQITLQDMEYGLCGAAGVEITPDQCGAAGLLCNQNQTVTFAGTVVARNISDGNTRYFTLLGQSAGLTIPQVVLGSIQLAGLQNDPAATNLVNLQDGNYYMNFFALKFNDISTGTLNTSVLQYSGNFQNGLANATDSKGSIDTEHQYIILTLANNLGEVILYNFNYAGE